MPGPDLAEASPEDGQDHGPGGSRNHLRDLTERLKELGESTDADALNTLGLYWLYEHLRRLSLEAESILAELEGQLGPPITIGNAIEAFINPLKAIYEDLATYYWRADCLLERLAETDFDWLLHSTIREVRKDWGRLSSATREYLAVRQEKDSWKRSEQLLLTGEAFQMKVLEFVNTLSRIVSRRSFASRHSRLATLAGRTSGQRRGRRRSQAEPGDTGGL